MGLMTLAAAFIGLQAVSTISQNRAIDDQIDATGRQANADIAELDRQRREASEIAQEKKADRVREADKQTASLIASLADVGGAGTVNESRFVQETGFLEGLDLARIEGNRQRQVEALRSKQTSVRNSALNTVDQMNAKKSQNVLGFFTSAVGTGLTVRSAQAGKAKAKTDGYKG